MISEGSCDTDWSNDAENSALPIHEYCDVSKETRVMNGGV